MGENDAEAGNLRDREVDEDDAAIENLYAERHVRRGDEEPRHARRPENRPVERREAHLRPALSRARVSSKSPKRSLAPAVPPTVNGTTIVGSFARSLNQSAGRGSL